MTHKSTFTPEEWKLLLESVMMADIAVTAAEPSGLWGLLRPRLSRRWRGTFGVLFSPAASDKALKMIRQTVRSWALHERSDKSLDDLARMFNSHIRGWINYYGRYYKSALYPTLRHIDRILTSCPRWVKSRNAAKRDSLCRGRAGARSDVNWGAHDREGSSK